MKMILSRFAGLALILVIITCLGVASCEKKDPHSYSCITGTLTFARNDEGDSIDEITTLCGGIAFSTTESLALRQHYALKPVVFFSFDASGIEPHVTWIGKRDLQVYMFRTEGVGVQLDHVGDIAISYKIGTQFESTIHLYGQCASHNRSGVQWCLQYVSTVIDETGDTSQSGICLPRESPAERYVDITRTWIRAHPGDNVLPAEKVVKRALRAAFPCN